jgi:hypothetical protein
MRDSLARFAVEQPKEVRGSLAPSDVKQAEEIPVYLLSHEIANAGRKAERELADNPAEVSTGLPSSLGLKASPVVIRPGPPKPRVRFKVLRQFEGTVLEISKEECRARVRDLRRFEIVEEITFSTEEISESDREIAVPGSVFYWDIGYQDHIDGQRLRVSVIRFRRIPVWREKDLAAAKKEAKSLSESLGWKR